MFKLLKWSIYGLLGYAIYEMYLGVRDASMGGRQFAGEEGGEQGRMGTLTGGGRGSTEKTEEAGGTSASHSVGRGVR